MTERILADVLVLLHLAFIVFVLAGALWVMYQRWMAWLHLPAVIWAVLLEFNGWICPLTPLENHFRRLAGQEGYAGGFVEHYLIPLIYPQSLTEVMQIILGLIVLLVNGVVYAWVISKARKPVQ